VEPGNANGWRPGARRGVTKNAHGVGLRVSRPKSKGPAAAFWRLEFRPFEEKLMGRLRVCLPGPAEGEPAVRAASKKGRNPSQRRSARADVLSLTVWGVCSFGDGSGRVETVTKSLEVVSSASLDMAWKALPRHVARQWRSKSNANP